MKRPTYADLPDIALADLFDAYAKAGEHMDGPSFWDNFDTVDEVLGDFYLHQGWKTLEDFDAGLCKLKSTQRVKTAEVYKSDVLQVLKLLAPLINITDMTRANLSPQEIKTWREQCQLYHRLQGSLTTKPSYAPTSFTHKHTMASREIREWITDQENQGRTVVFSIGSGYGSERLTVAWHSSSPNPFGGDTDHGSMALDGHFFRYG